MLPLRNTFGATLFELLKNVYIRKLGNEKAFAHTRFQMQNNFKKLYDDGVRFRLYVKLAT